MIDSVCILAGGKGSRLYPLTFHVPKILVNLHTENILTKSIKYWKAYCKNFIIITNPEYVEYIDFYCKECEDIQYEIRTIHINNEENSYALKQVLTDVDGKNLLITWCDVFPTQAIDTSIFEDNIIFVNNFSNYKSRYLADEQSQRLEKVIDYSHGNVIGIYFVKNFKTLRNENDKQDFCDCFKQNYGYFKTYDIEVVDIGDKEKLNAYFLEQKNLFTTRFFNHIQFVNTNIIKKESTCAYGDEIIKKEIDFYLYLQQHNLRYPFAKFTQLSDTSFHLDYIKEESFYHSLLKSHDIKSVFTLLTFVKNVYESSPEKKVTYEEAKHDLQLETTDKILKRYQQVEQLLKSFDYIRFCDYVQIETYEGLRAKIQNRIEVLLQKINPTYRVIHGDLNLSNVFCTNPFTFIDPRGYYGTSRIYGLPYYDFAKIYFSLLGFDALNLETKYFFTIQEDNIVPNIQPFFKELPIFSNLFSDEEYELILYIAISIWLGLPFYFKDNFSKVVGSYFYARYLGTLYLQQIEDLVKAKRARRYEYFNTVSLIVSKEDTDALQLVKTKAFKQNLQPFSYKNKIIKKPWGFEFVAYEAKKIALLCLHMQKHKSTSLHCHQKKDTSFIIAQGKVCVHTLDSYHYLTTGDTCFIQRGKFHKIESLEENTIVLEFEIKNPSRSDLLRYRDDYNREDQGYEGIQNMISDITSESCSDYFEFSVEQMQPLEKLFKTSKITLAYHIGTSNLADIFVVLNGYIVVDGKYYSSGSFLRGADLYKKQVATYKDFICLHFESLVKHIL